MCLIGLVDGYYDGGLQHVVFGHHHMQWTTRRMSEEDSADSVVVLVDFDDLVVGKYCVELIAGHDSTRHLVHQRRILESLAPGDEPIPDAVGGHRIAPVKAVLSQPAR